MSHLDDVRRAYDELVYVLNTGDLDAAPKIKVDDRLVELWQDAADAEMVMERYGPQALGSKPLWHIRIGADLQLTNETGALSDEEFRMQQIKHRFYRSEYDRRVIVLKSLGFSDEAIFRLGHLA